MVRVRQTLLDAFFKHVKKRKDGCWWWNGYHNADGTPRFGNGPAYQWIHEATKGDVPEGMILHHTCKRHWCVNPEHTEAVTRSQHYDLHRD